MALEHRRTATKTTERKSRTSTRTSTKRRKRKFDPKNAACIAIATFAVVFLSIGLIASLLLGKSSTTDTNTPNNSVNEGGRFLKGWKPRESAPVISAEEERAQQREARYQSLYRHKFDASTLGYDIYNCPAIPPEGYPKAWTTTEVLLNWNPNDVTTIEPNYREVYQGICVFDYQTQYDIALTYRNAEKPFVIRNDPKVMSVARKWDDDPEYLHRVLGDVEQFRTERSPINQFMWYRLRGKDKGPRGYEVPPNDETEMPYGEWLEHALNKDAKALGSKELEAKVRALKERRLSTLGKKEEEQDPLGIDDEDKDNNNKEDEESEETKQSKWYYFRINVSTIAAKKGSVDKFIYDELPFFDPRKRKDSSFYIVDPDEERGINCRFGMRGVIAANHFDLSRNMIAVFGGERRYVLSNPSQCSKMALYPRGHPSLRHSSIDWSNPTEWDIHPEFKEALVNEVVLHAGDMLYLPTSWFHYIVNLGLNYQCNARSGTTVENMQHIADCGFK